MSPSEIAEVKDALNGHDPAKPTLFSLGHPSSLAIGTGHGVFKFNQEEKAKIQRPGVSAVLIEECVEVLQKPTIEKMRSKGNLNKGQLENSFEKQNVFWTLLKNNLLPIIVLHEADVTTECKR